MVRRLIVLLLLVFSFRISFGQDLKMTLITKKGSYYAQKESRIEKGQSYALVNQLEFSSISIQINESQSFKGSYLIDKKDTFFLSIDEHVIPKGGVVNSNLVFFDQSTSQIKFYANEIEGNALFHFINGGDVQEVGKEKSQRICLAEPESIAQDIWRSGLSTPSFNRSFSNVSHLIIHHSAGSNTNTNYTQVVRDIYIYHTEVNGWSDIGYNYLIAQDGTIFKGRDPDQGNQDNVRGAHFCSMNTGTMGVCLLGNYTNIAPTFEAVQSLFRLLSWKLDKESLNAFELFSFNSIPNLGAISGHRDGCATECPGSKIYEQITDFKHQINQQIEGCYPEKLIADFEWDADEVIVNQSINFIDISTGTPLSWDWQFEGATQIYYSEKNVTTTYPNTGEFTTQLIVRNGSRMDTVQKSVSVKDEPLDIPLVFPNPVQKNDMLSIRLDKDKVDEVVIINLSGSSSKTYFPQENEFHLNLNNVNNVNNGIYLIQFFSSTKIIKTEKIVVLK